MNIKETQSGGRIAQGKTAYGDYRVEWDAKGNLLSHTITIKEPPPPQSRGLGDTIAKMTSAVGIKPCAGCKRRQALANRLFPYTISK